MQRSILTRRFITKMHFCTAYAVHFPAVHPVWEKFAAEKEKTTNGKKRNIHLP